MVSKRVRRSASFAACVAMAAACGSTAQAVIKDFDNGGGDLKFLTPANWNDFVGGDDDTLPGANDRAIINNNFVVAYDAAVTTTLTGLVVGADWPVTGDTGTAGTLNMTTGKIIVSGGGDSFQLGRAAFNGTGIMTMSGNAELEITGSDPVVGTRDTGVLNVTGNSQVHPTGTNENYWRLGNYGPSIDSGLEGNGLLNVQDNGSFRAHVIFIADNDATGEVRVSGNGSVQLTGNLVPRPSGFQAGGSATVRMTGSNATLSAFNLESESLAGEVATKYIFDADAGGISEITLQDAINITNDALEVNLNAFVLGPGASVLLFDGDQALAGNRIFGTFATLTVNGVANPANYAVTYEQLTGDILLTNTVPEPASLALFGLAGLMLRRRRAEAK